MRWWASSQQLNREFQWNQNMNMYGSVHQKSTVKNPRELQLVASWSIDCVMNSKKFRVFLIELLGNFEESIAN